MHYAVRGRDRARPGTAYRRLAESQSCLEVAVGDAMLGVIAIDNDKDRMVYVGPLYSYYEFRQNVEKRLTDPEWQKMSRENLAETLKQGAEGWADESFAMHAKWDFDPAEIRASMFSAEVGGSS